jgi:hypothetical protein
MAAPSSTTKDKNFAQVSGGGTPPLYIPSDEPPKSAPVISTPSSGYASYTSDSSTSTTPSTPTYGQPSDETGPSTGYGYGTPSNTKKSTSLSQVYKDSSSENKKFNINSCYLGFKANTSDFKNYYDSDLPLYFVSTERLDY